MRKITCSILLSLIGIYCNGQVKIFVKFYCQNSSASLTSCDLITEENTANHTDEIPITTFSDEDSTTLQNTGGAGAGKAQMLSTVFSKQGSVNSAVFALNLYSGKFMRKVQFTIYDSQDRPIQTVVFGLVLIKRIARVAASCTNTCPGVIENYTFTSQQKLITSYSYGSSGSPTMVTSGWDFVANRAISTIN